MQFLRTILLIVLLYFGFKVIMRLYNAVTSDGNKKQQNKSDFTQSKKKNRKPNFGNTSIEDADYEEIK